jgi:GT2 family glycosyltransferase
LREQKPLFSFLILHYQTEKDTNDCVNSILRNIDYDNYNIVIVDNGSPNKSGYKLQKDYKNNRKINILVNDKNLGFAKGNNLGFKYIKENYNSDFIVMINNDTIIEDKNFLKNIKENYNKKRFDILGPKIISLVDNQNQNPVKVNFNNIKQVRKQINKTKVILFLEYIYVKKPIKNLFKIIKRKKHENNKTLNAMLHGSCLVFSKDYIKKYGGLYDKTFMYNEEDILYFIAKRDNLTMRYTNEAIIYHKEDSATNSVMKKERKKRIFIYKNSIKSLKELYKLMKESKKRTD